MRYIPRLDQYGNSLTQATPGRTALFTGPAGSGKSTELDRLEFNARQNGHIVFRIKSLTEEYLGNQAVRAVNSQLDDIAQQLPPAGRFRRGLRGFRDRFLNWRSSPRPADDPRMASLRETAHAMGGLRRAERKGSMWSAGVFGFGGRSMDALDQQTELPRATLNDLSDRLGDVAKLSDRRVVFLVDDIHALDEKKGLAAFNEWARHLAGRSDGNVDLAAAGRSEVYGRLATASSMVDGVYHDPSRLFDHRQPQPVSNAELHRAMLDSTPANVQVKDGAAEQLLDAAGGNPQRMHEYHQAALQFSQPQWTGHDYNYSVGPESAAAGINAVHKRREPLYQAIWNDMEDSDRDLLKQVGDRGARGVARTDIQVPIGKDGEPDREQGVKLDRAREKAVQAGWMTESAQGRLKFADAGLGDWVRTQELGKPPLIPSSTPAPQSLAHQQVPLQPGQRGVGAAPQAGRAANQTTPMSAQQAAQLASTGQTTAPPGTSQSQQGQSGRSGPRGYVGRHRRNNGPQQGNGR